MQRDLVLRARGGDHDAFTALAEAAFEHLTRTARLILRGDDEAADAVQEALVAAWLHIRAVREPDRFDAWLHRLVVHACYRVARRSKRRRVMEIDVARMDVPGRTDAQGPSVLRDQLERGFRRMTAEQRAVLVVHHHLGRDRNRPTSANDSGACPKPSLTRFFSRPDETGRRPSS